ncbi:SMP-30/gluconolactonase/LRE family protein [Brevibacillus sp. SYP-B805]|uniref:TolB family protein n=1 Tax=Brevibacillus sp. SYP-B805 TaxID=1578199 RepID=UPI0013ED25C2|nr:SMP-30/gluconolactonase/LRE family protein [Brevibacillus sp. SYP-B805]NGQ97378.1 SMP-30/gluconolactonase/LRE family protein [Brevibacillus sp. SYP-B805]
MKRILTILAALLLCSFGGNDTLANSNQGSPAAERTIIYKVFTDPKKPAQIVGRLTPMHWASLSPGERFLYTERIDPATNQLSYYVFDFALQQFTPLAGPGTWYPKHDLLVIVEGNHFVLYNPETRERRELAVLEDASAIVDMVVSPDEKHLAILTRKDLSQEHQKQAALYILDLETSAVTLRDSFTVDVYWKEYHENKLYWHPDSQHVYYYGQWEQAPSAKKSLIKRLDITSGETQLSGGRDFPSFSPDLSVSVGYAGNAILLKDLAGNVVNLGEGSKVTDIHWSPMSHAYVGVQPLGPIGAGADARETIRYQDKSRFFYFPAIPFAKYWDNLRFVGWARDGKSFYVADLAPIPYEWHS